VFRFKDSERWMIKKVFVFSGCVAVHAEWSGVIVSLCMDSCRPNQRTCSEATSRTARLMSGWRAGESRSSVGSTSWMRRRIESQSGDSVKVVTQISAWHVVAREEGFGDVCGRREVAGE
jgi:hypothetical protein